MNIVSSFRLFVLSYTKRILKRFIRTRHIGPDIQALDIDPSMPTVYAQLYSSYAERVVIDKQAQALGWEPAFASHLEHRKQGGRFFSIYRRKRIGRRRTHTPIVSNDLVKQAQWLLEDPSRQIQIIPVQVFWGRSPSKEKSFLRIWLQNSGTVGGRLATLMAILLNGRNTAVHYSRPIMLRDLADDNMTAKRLAHKVARVLRVHSRQVSAAVLGPDLSHRRTLVHTLPNRPSVLDVINEEAQNSASKRRKLRKQALKYADEIASNISYTNVRFLDVVLSWVWNRIYNGIVLHNIEPLKEISKDNEIVYVPCHRSHIDYLLLSYVLYYQGLQLPQIAAGINLNMPVVGSILRRGGAFFMRRTFRGNPLYSAVFDEYLHIIFTRGYATEFFVEGGRSRTGRTLPPKTGMLAMTLRSYLRNSRKPIILMPVYTGYEKVFEANSYLGELRGQKKKKESIFGLLGTLRSFKNSFGKVYVTFGDPIHLTKELDQQQPNWQNNAYEKCQFRPEWSSDFVNHLSTRVVTEINRATSVNPVNLLALSILSSPRQALDKQQLLQLMCGYRDLIAASPYCHLTQYPSDTPEAWLEHVQALDMASSHSHPLGDLIKTDERQSVTLTYYRNNVLHLFALPSLIACLLLNNRNLTRSDVHEFISLLYPFIQAELFLQWSNDELKDMVNQWLDVLKTQGLTEEQGDELFAINTYSPQTTLLNSLSDHLSQTLMRYFLVLQLLKTHAGNGISIEQLERFAILLAERLSVLHGINAPEFFDKNIFRVFIQQLLKDGHITSGDDESLYRPIPSLIDTYERLKHTLPNYVLVVVADIANAPLEDIDES